MSLNNLYPERKAQEAADKSAGIVRFSTNSGGKPENHDVLNWLESKETFVYSTTANGAAYRWQGAVKAVEIECDKADTGTFAGSIVWRKFRHEGGTEFYFGYGNGSPHSFDHAVIRSK